MNGLLLFLSAVVAAAALLTVRPAPNYRWAWKLAILVGEFGHWLVALPLGLAWAAGVATDGAWRGAVWLLCAVAVFALLRPGFSAWRIARRLGPGAFSWRRLYAYARAPGVAMRTEIFARPDGHDLKLDFYPARGAPNAPCIVVIHGGGWDGGDRTQLAGWNPRLAAQGYAVAAVSYRLAPRAIWPAQGEDVRAAIAWLQAQAGRLGIDANRLVLFGRSAGGQLATAVGYGARDPAIRGVVALYGPHDMPFAWSVSRPDDALNSVRLMTQYFGGPPDTPERRNRYATASGQLLATVDAPPTLLIHGLADTLAWHRHSARLAARLQELGVKHEYLCLPWATHGFDFNPHGPGGQLTDFVLARFLAGVTR